MTIRDYIMLSALLFVCGIAGEKGGAGRGEKGGEGGKGEGDCEKIRQRGEGKGRVRMMESCVSRECARG